jgi:hypothetical protein
MSAKEAAKPQAVEAEDKPKMIRAMDPRRVRVLAEVVGEPRVVTLEDHLDPLEVLANEAHWVALPSSLFVVGARFELTNDSGTYLYQVWIRAMFGTKATGLRGVRFHPQVVWDERAEAVPAEALATGRWEVRYDGRFYLWRVYNPKGVVMGPSFNDETAATAYLRQQESNPRAR